MKLAKNIRLSWKALLLNKSRTSFAIAGLSIGITTLTLKDADAIAEECPSVEKVVPTADTYVKIKYEDTATMVMVQGASSDFTEVKNFPVGEGRFFTSEEDKLTKAVAVLGI